ncbi:hypothetical protein AB0H12_42950 [Actinosynnema sp. NPDC023794]
MLVPDFDLPQRSQRPVDAPVATWAAQVTIPTYLPEVPGDTLHTSIAGSVGDLPNRTVVPRMYVGGANPDTADGVQESHAAGLPQTTCRDSTVTSLPPPDAI